MRKYLELFTNGFDETIDVKTKPENKPYIGYSLTEGKVAYTIVPAKEDEPEIDLTIPYVTFTAEEDNSSIGLTKLSTYQTLEYSTDTTTWNTFDTTTNISLNNGDKVHIRGILNANNSSPKYTRFKMTGKITAYGNCNAIWNYEDLNAPLKNYCGWQMFKDCTSLVMAPVLPATTLASNCYGRMFSGCTSLTVAPALPATILESQCYQEMFSGCTSLTAAPELPATELDRYCYHQMFDDCTSLTTVQKILPATTLASNCYDSMFRNCSSLTVAPILPAATFVEFCYQEMFSGCTSLNHITCLATSNPLSVSQSVYEWVDGVASIGTFIKHPDMIYWRNGTSGIPSGWTVEDAVL